MQLPLSLDKNNLSPELAGAFALARVAGTADTPATLLGVTGRAQAITVHLDYVDDFVSYFVVHVDNVVLDVEPIGHYRCNLHLDGSETDTMVPVTRKLINGEHRSVVNCSVSVIWK